MAAETLTTLAAYLKRLYVNNPDLTALTIKQTPFLNDVAMAQMNSDLAGEDTRIPLKVDQAPGLSAALSTALTNHKAGTKLVWAVPRRTLYDAHSIDGISIHATKRNVASFVSAKAEGVADKFEYFAQQMGRAVWNDGAGDMGVITAITAGADPATSITVSSQYGQNFVVGQVLEASATRTGGAVRGDEYTITAVNVGISDTVLTVSRTTDTGTAVWAVGDYLYLRGTYDLMPQGVAAYIPSTDPGVSGVPTTLNNVLRTSRPAELAGWRVAYQGSISETIRRTLAQMEKFTKPGRLAIWLSTYNFFRLGMEQRGFGSLIYDDSTNAKFGVRSIVVDSPRGTVRVMADPFLSDAQGYVLDHSTWKFLHLGQVPHIIQDDGNLWLRHATADEVIMRIRAWVNMVCVRPAANAVFLLSA